MREEHVAYYGHLPSLAARPTYSWLESVAVIDDSNDWESAGFRDSAIKQAWSAAFPRLDDAVAWRLATPDPFVARKLADAGVDASKARAWLVECGVSWREIVKWREMSFTLPNARPWIKLGIAPAQARALTDRGITAKAVRARIGSGLSSDEIIHIRGDV
jgi:hypothetical protein